MDTAGDFLLKRRKSKKISLKKAALDLLIKEENLNAIEKSQWQDLPEPTFVKGFIKNYAQYLGLDEEHVLALYRREFDEAKYPEKKSPLTDQKRLMITPNKFLGFVFVLTVIVFLIYITGQYFSILKAPKLEVITPQEDLKINIPYVIVSGKVEAQSTVAVDGEFVPIDESGNFSYQIKLEEGKNIVEIIASKRLSPKTKITRVVRLSP